MAALKRGSLVLAAAVLAAFGTLVWRPEPREDIAPAADTANTSASIVWLERRLSADPENGEVAARLASRYVLRFGTGADLEDVRRAEAQARSLLSRSPDRGAGLARLSAILLMQHRFAEAVEAAEAALKAEPQSQDALGAFVDAALAIGRPDAALAALEQMRAGSLAALVRRAHWLESAGRHAAAESVLDRVCTALERSAARAQVVAWCFTERARPLGAAAGDDAARGLYERALTRLPGYRAAVEGLAGLALARGAYREAERRYRDILSDAHPDLYLRMAETAAALERPVEAAAWESRFVDVASRPGNEALFGAPLAEYLASRDDRASLKRALGIARGEVERRPTGESWDLLAWAHWRRGEREAALHAVREASRRGLASPAMRPHREDILEGWRAARGG